jgi:pimeloyl-ACP methyl ester carboxylesterase
MDDETGTAAKRASSLAPTAHHISCRRERPTPQNRAMNTLLLSFALVSGLFSTEPFQVTVTGHGQPMILIPGLSSSGETWDTTVAHYRERYECHVLTVAGFAGVPRIPSPILDRVRERLAAYIREKKLDHPVIVGHSLGGFVALDLAVHYPDLPGRLVIVDAYPFFAGASNPATTAEQAKQMVAGLRQYMGMQTQDDYVRYVKSGVATRSMVDKESDFDRITAWGLASDRTAVTDAMCEMFGADLREDLAAIKAPTLVLGSWIAYKQYTDRQQVEANLRAQYAKLAGVRIDLTDTARHFIMWDDPAWMFARVDGFLTSAR